MFKPVDEPMESEAMTKKPTWQQELKALLDKHSTPAWSGSRMVNIDEVDMDEFLKEIESILKRKDENV
jgi:hypothetical protein